MDLFFKLLFRFAEIGILTCVALYVLIPAGATVLGAWAFGHDMPSGGTLAYLTGAWFAFHVLMGILLWRSESE